MSDVQDGLNVGRNGPNWIYRDTLYVAHRDIRLDCHVHHEDVVRHEYRRRWTGDGSLADDLRSLCHTCLIIINLFFLTVSFNEYIIYMNTSKESK